MQRFFLPPEHFSDQQVTFPPEICHQITQVLRLVDGDLVAVLDNTGFLHHVRLQMKPGEKGVKGTIFETMPVKSETKTRVSLCFGLSNREKVEWILQKGTEIGVSAFYPFVSSRTLGRSTALSSEKRERWERIIREAAEQSRRGRLPILHQPGKLADCISVVGKEHDLSLVAWEEASENTETIAGYLNDFSGDSIALFIGPEGGFSDDEVDMALEGACRVVSLGPRILRMETAAIVFPTLVLSELGEL